MSEMSKSLNVLLNSLRYLPKYTIMAYNVHSFPWFATKFVAASLTAVYPISVLNTLMRNMAVICNSMSLCDSPSALYVLSTSASVMHGYVRHSFRCIKHLGQLDGQKKSTNASAVGKLALNSSLIFSFRVFEDFIDSVCCPIFCSVSVCLRYFPT